MIYLGWILMFFGAIRLFVAFLNWISRLHLPPCQPLTFKPKISILIPARNEESNIGLLLSDLSTFEYEPIEILVYDDLSTDQTASVIKRYATQNSTIKYIEGKPLPDGWLGKNNACHQLAKAATGQLYLFLDADVRVQSGLVENAISFIQKHKLKLLSIFPRQIMEKVGVKLSVMLINWVLLSLLPLFMVRKSSWKSFSAANGQFMLFDANIYRKILPHQHFKQEKVEDIAIMYYYKKQKIKVAALLGDSTIQCKMYSGFSDSVNGFSKNIFQFFGGSILVTLLFAIVTTFTPFYLFLFNGKLEGILYLFSILWIRIFVSLASKQSVIDNLFLMPAQQFTFLKIIFNALRNKRKKSILWKERNIYL